MHDTNGDDGINTVWRGKFTKIGFREEYGWQKVQTDVKRGKHMQQIRISPNRFQEKLITGRLLSMLLTKTEERLFSCLRLMPLICVRKTPTVTVLTSTVVPKQLWAIY